MLTSVYRILWRHRLWIVLLTGVLVGTTWLLTSRQQKEYTASTLIRVTQKTTNAEDVFGALQTGERLARTYVPIAETYAVGREIRERVPDSVPDDAINIDAKQVGTLELIRLSSTYRDPEVAAKVANAAPAALKDFIEKKGTSRDIITTIEDAGVPSTPSSPNMKLNLAIAFLLGLILSGGLVLLIESFSDRVEGVDELERITGYPVIATIPVLKLVSLVRAGRTRSRQTEEELQTLAGAKLGVATAAGARGSTRDDVTVARSVPGPRRVEERGSPAPSRSSLVDPGSPSAEAFRTLRLALQLRGNADSSGAVLFTSAEPAAGKSTIAANFSLVSALGRGRVLLIDADLRKPVQHEIFGLARGPGLGAARAHDAPRERVIQRGPARLDVLTAGREIPRASDVLASTRMRDMLTEAASRYELVVVDTSPVLAAADAEGISSHSDLELVFVVDRASRRRNIVKAVRRLDRLSARIAGVVMNRDGRHEEYYGY